MSVEKAKTLLRSLRWHHLGFAFVWAITFAGLAVPDGFAGQRLFSLSDQLCALAAVGAAVLYERRRMPFPPRSALMVGVLLAAGSAAYYLAANGIVPVLPGSLAAGVLVGLALGSSYVLWQQFFASEGASRTAVFIPLSALLSVALSVLLALLPDAARALCSVVVLPAAAAVSLGRCLREIVPADPRPRMTGTAAAATVRMLWKPVFCTCAIGFVWKLVSHLFAVPGGITSPPVLAGMALAVAVVVLIELLSETGFAVLRVYQILFPLVTGAFLLPTLLGVQFAPFASGMLLFGALRFCQRLRLNGILQSMLASALAALAVMLMVGFGLGQNPDKIIIGNIMLLIPGIALTTSLRDMINGDTISGLLGLSEAVLKALAIAIGFAAVLMRMGG